ncbi:MAG TPA: D-aminoacylase [Vicinamibacterales bacterium]|nr:D-aminoacylase [Vicinamibacterales bacterium]
MTSTTRIRQAITFGALTILCGWATAERAGRATPFVLEARTAESVVITNASIVDGAGGPARRGSVRITGDRIVDVGSVTAHPGERVIDANGLTLAPGFIDTHSHHDRGLLEQRDVLAALSQGITTIVVGQDGGSSYPLSGFFGRLNATPVSVNVASYAGHGTVRRRVMGSDFKRVATAAEVAKMEALLREEMQAGALGLSSGLEYDPGIYSAPGELIALANVVAPFGGRYISHVRSEDRAFWSAIDEAINIGREARIPVQISHLKLAMRSLWGQTDRLIRTLDAARATGVSVTADIYPYPYWQSGMTVLFPNRDFDNRLEAEFALREVTSPEGLLITRFAPNRSYEGKTLADLATLRGVDAPKAMMDMIREAGDGDIGIVATSMDERDIAKLITWPFANICSDGTSDGGHPRGFGAFTRVLGRYVRQPGGMTLEEAVRKMTSLSAANTGLRHRGTVRAGSYADLVLFDPATTMDRATTSDPKAVSVGVHSVWVNGEIVFQDGKTTGRFPGRVLRRQ